MTRRVLAVALLGAAMVLTLDTQEASAFGGRSRKSCGPPPCPPPSCDTSCGYGSGSGYNVSWVEQKVTGYRPEWKTKKVDVVVVEHKMVEQPYTYWVSQPVVTKQKAKVCEMAQSEQPYTYVVNKMVESKQKVKVCQVTWQQKEVPYTWYEAVHAKTQVKRTVYDCSWVPTVVNCTVPCYTGGCWSRCCGGCGSPCVSYTNVSYTVNKPVYTPRDVMVDVWTCNYVERKGNRMVSIPVENWVEQEVPVWTCVPTKVEGKRWVSTPTWVEREVNVSTWQNVEQKGTRMVPQPFETKRTVEQPYCEWVKYETVVKVPVYTPAPSTSWWGCCH